MMDSYNERSPMGSQGSRYTNTAMNGNPCMRCKHKWKAVIRVSSSETNPGRLYYSCPKEKVSERCCGFLGWVDEEGVSEANADEASSSMGMAQPEDEE